MTRTVRPVGSTVALSLLFRENWVDRGWGGGAILKGFGSQWVRLGGTPAVIAGRPAVIVDTPTVIFGTPFEITNSLNFSLIQPKY